MNGVSISSEAVLGQVAAGGLIDLRSNQEILLETWPAQIEVAVLETDGLVGGLVADFERRRFGSGKDRQAVRADLDVPGGQVRIAMPAAGLDGSRDTDTEFRSQLACQSVGLGAEVRLEDYLCDTATIP